MTNPMRVTVEVGPKGKKVVAVAPDWPGLQRGAKTAEKAIEKLRAYLPRYSHVARLAAMNAEFDTIENIDVVEAVSYTHLDVYKRQLLDGVGLGGLDAGDLGQIGRQALQFFLQGMEMCIRDSPGRRRR